MHIFPQLLRATAPALLFSLSAACAFAAPAPKIDPQALALLQKIQTTSLRMHSLSASFETDTIMTDMSPTARPNSPKIPFREIASFRVMKPNYLREQRWSLEKSKATGLWEKPTTPLTAASDGHKTWVKFGVGQYSEDSADPQGHNLYAALPSEDFFDPSKSVLAQVKKQQEKGQLLSLNDAGVQRWEGHPYRVVVWNHVFDAPMNPPLPDSLLRTVPGGVLTERDCLYIGADNLVHRTVSTFNIGWSVEETARNIKINTVMTASAFKFAPPPGAQLSKPYAAPEPPKPLLAVGTPAPDFAATAPDGSTVHLSDYKGKTVVLDFWSTWCGPCQMSMPHLEKVYQAVKDKNVAVLGVCVWDRKPEYDKWVAAKKDTYHFPTAFDPAVNQEDSIASKLYHVSGIPTQYVIDKDGNIAASTVGYDEKGTELENALKKQGVEVAAAKP